MKLFYVRIRRAHMKPTVRHVTEIVQQKNVARLTPQTMTYSASQSH